MIKNRKQLVKEYAKKTPSKLDTMVKTGAKNFMSNMMALKTSLTKVNKKRR